MRYLKEKIIMIIRNARVFIDGQFHDYDVRTENGIITEIADRIDGEGFDAEGKYLFAGFIDVHLRDFLKFKISCMATVQNSYFIFYWHMFKQIKKRFQIYS